MQLDAGSYPCLTQAEKSYPHEGIWYFFGPFGATMAVLLIICVVRRNTNVPFPRPGFIDFEAASTQQNVQDIGLQVVGTVEQSEQPRTTPQRQRSDETIASNEVQVDHMRTCLALTASLLVFVGPHAVIQFLPYVLTHNHAVVWRISYTWLCCKSLFEPFLIMAFSKKYRLAFHFWKYRDIRIN